MSPTLVVVHKMLDLPTEATNVRLVFLLPNLSTYAWLVTSYLVLNELETCIPAITFNLVIVSFA